MPVIGFNLEKIDVEKKNKISGKINIKNNLSIKNIEQEKLAIGKSEDVLKFNFEYTINYEPEIGKILMQGNVLYMEDPQKVKEILEGWEKNKKISEKLSPIILNTILSRCNIKALTLSQEVNLPPHINMPLLKPTKNN